MVLSESLRGPAAALVWFKKVHSFRDILRLAPCTVTTSLRGFVLGRVAVTLKTDSIFEVRVAMGTVLGESFGHRTQKDFRTCAIASVQGNYSPGIRSGSPPA